MLLACLLAVGIVAYFFYKMAGKAMLWLAGVLYVLSLAGIGLYYYVGTQPARVDNQAQIDEMVKTVESRVAADPMPVTDSLCVTSSVYDVSYSGKALLMAPSVLSPQLSQVLASATPGSPVFKVNRASYAVRKMVMRRRHDGSAGTITLSTLEPVAVVGLGDAGAKLDVAQAMQAVSQLPADAAQVSQLGLSNQKIGWLDMFNANAGARGGKWPLRTGVLSRSVQPFVLNGGLAVLMDCAEQNYEFEHEVTLVPRSRAELTQKRFMAIALFGVVTLLLIVAILAARLRRKYVPRMKSDIEDELNGLRRRLENRDTGLTKWD